MAKQAEIIMSFVRVLQIVIYIIIKKMKEQAKWGVLLRTVFKIKYNKLPTDRKRTEKATAISVLFSLQALHLCSQMLFLILSICRRYAANPQSSFFASGNPRRCEPPKLILRFGEPQPLGSIYLPCSKFDITALAVGFDMI